MSKIQSDCDALRAIPEESWEALLLVESGLPGPRGNLELATAVAEVGSRASKNQEEVREMSYRMCDFLYL